MKPSAYFPFYGNDFFEAVAGYSDTVSLSYLRALWHYWNHTGCEGLPDDDEYLCRVCGSDEANWLKTKGIVFDNHYHFRLENGLWHQARCKAEFQKSQEIYAARSAAGKRGMAKRWQKH